MYTIKRRQNMRPSSTSRSRKKKMETSRSASYITDIYLCALTCNRNKIGGVILINFKHLMDSLSKNTPFLIGFLLLLMVCGRARRFNTWAWNQSWNGLEWLGFCFVNDHNVNCNLSCDHLMWQIYFHYASFFPKTFVKKCPENWHVIQHKFSFIIYHFFLFFFSSDLYHKLASDMKQTHLMFSESNI